MNSRRRGRSARRHHRHLRFHDDPAVHVEFHGTSGHASNSTRTRLPDPVEPAVTYRDIRVDYRLTATARDPVDDPEAGP